MARRTKKELVECLTEAQREGIRRGWKMPGAYFPGEWEQEKAVKDEERMAKLGLPMNPHELLLQVAERPPAMKEPQLGGGQPLEDGRPAPRTIDEGSGEEPLAAIKAIRICI